MLLIEFSPRLLEVLTKKRERVEYEICRIGNLYDFCDIVAFSSVLVNSEFVWSGWEY